MDRTKVSLLTAVGVVLLAGLAILPFGHHVDTWNFTPPLTGSPVDHYIGQAQFEIPSGARSVRIYVDGVEQKHSLRIVAVDTAGRFGVFSDVGQYDGEDLTGLVIVFSDGTGLVPYVLESR